MISKTKYKIDNAAIGRIFASAGIDEVKDIAPLGAGEYNAVFSASGGGREYALKIAPTDSVPVMAYEKNMIASEVFWYEQIKKYTSIQTPEIYHVDFDRKVIPTNYFIMEKLPGQQLDKMDFSESEKAEAATVTAKMAAELYKIKNDKFGYVQSGLHDSWYLAIKAMVAAMINDCSVLGIKTARGEKLLKFIEEHKAVLEKAECCMVNSDMWPPNILCRREDGGIKYAWIDPERSFWGDRIVNFLCLEMMKPLAEKKLSIEAYNSVADKPVAVTQDEEIRYAVALGFLGLIMEAEKYYRYTPRHFGWWRNVMACRMLYKEAFR